MEYNIKSNFEKQLEQDSKKRYERNIDKYKENKRMLDMETYLSMKIRESGDLFDKILKEW